MKRIVHKFACSLLVISPCLYAQDNFLHASGDQFYLGADVVVGGSTKLKALDHTFDDSANVGVSLVGGYEFNTHNVVKPSLELEYRHYGQSSIQSIDVDGQGFFVNAKAKLFVEYDFGNVYLAPMVGIGVVDFDIQNSTTKADYSGTESTFQAGAEIGTRLNKNIDLSAGYRWAYADIDSVDVTLDGFYLGIRYAF
ncbi:porin family protein [Vibrio ponticus]|uniref:Porin family protein n=1 Tax=Vibrio ponticus TaxID=265668 RepID=A0A3N3DX47_9VIBR|nr:outer membrane beta-barrel protein [Vibrio ponticus]ROV58758.1 porin family protein [Vibrio ponticus]